MGQMVDERVSTEAAQAAAWLVSLEEALSAKNVDALSSLFRADAYWRDLVAFTGFIRSFQGSDVVAATLIDLSQSAEPANFRLSTEFTEPSWQPRALEPTIEAFFEFETAQMNGKGIVRLVSADNDLGVVACAFMTAGQEFKGLEEPIGAHRREHATTEQFGETNWKEAMDKLAAFNDREPEVVVVGAGQCGLTVAASLRYMGTDVLTIEKNPRVGDNWRNRYHSLTLHNLLSVNKLPHMPFPATYPEYLPKDLWGAWLETYAQHMEIPVWTSTSLESGSYDDETGEWTLQVKRDGATRTLHTKHVVLATGGGICAVPNRPDFPGLSDFVGEVVHSSEAGTKLGDCAGKKAIVLGVGTSAHDIASQLVEAGADVTMVQRNPSIVISQPTANLYLTMFEERPAEEVDLIFNANSTEITKQGFTAMTQVAADLDRELTSKLEAVGFRTNNGVDDAGYFWNFLVRGGGYYINVGTSDQIIDGTIKLIQFDEIDTFTADGVRLTDGRQLGCDIVVLATGYANQNDEIRELFGDEMADRVGPVWGYGPDDEIRNTWRPTPQKGLWLVGGGIPHARNFGRYVALQIKGRLDGKLEGTDTSATTMWV